MKSQVNALRAKRCAECRVPIKNAGIRYRHGTRLREAFKIAIFSKYVPRVKPKPTP